MSDIEEIKKILRQILTVQLMNGADIERINNLLAENANKVPEITTMTFLNNFVEQLSQKEGHLKCILEDLPDFGSD